MPSRQTEVSDTTFLAIHTAWARDTAALTRQPTALYRDGLGLPRLTLTTWPMAGRLIATFEPPPTPVSGPARRP